MSIISVGRPACYGALTAVFLLGAAAVLFCAVSMKRAVLPQTAGQNVPLMAPDVETMVTGFEFNNYIDGNSTLQIKAKKFYRRGKKVLAFRLNLIKDNIFDDIAGSLVSRNSEITFSSDHAEGNLNAEGSLQLFEKVVLKINGKSIPVKHNAQINFDSKTILVDEKRVIGY
jgi:hypothetical protein